MQVPQFATFQLKCPSRSSPQQEAVGFSSYLLLLNANLICHIFPEGRRNPAKQKKVHVGDLVLLHSSNT